MGEYVISGSTHIELQGECGSGKFAIVQKSRLKSSGIEIAVKIINKTKTYEHTKNGEHKNDPFYRVEREITILSSLSHPHIVDYKGCYEDNENVYIIQDYVTYDNCKFDLDDYLLYHGNLSELHAHHLFCQLLSAIEYIHYKNICHCDLKTANVLISNIGIKLIDFGLSRYFHKDLLFHKVYGTPNYMSPEIYLNTPEPGYDGVKADIWACGIILFIMITQEKPFIGEDILELRNNIINHQYTPITTVSDELNDLLSKMFIKDPNERISLSQIKHHKWITSNITDSEEVKNNNNNLPLNRSSSITLALTKTTKQKNHQIIPSLYPNNPLFQSEPDINSTTTNNNKTNIPFNRNAVSIYEFIAEQNNEEEEEVENIENPKHKRHYSFQSFPISSLHSTKTTPSFKPRSMSSALSMSNTSPFLSSISLLPPLLINNSNSSSNTSLILPLAINASTNSINNSFSLTSSLPLQQNSTNGNSSNSNINNSSTTPTGQYSIYPHQSPFLQPIPVLPHTYSLSLDDDYGEEEEECDLDAIWQFRG